MTTGEFSGAGNLGPHNYAETVVREYGEVLDEAVRVGYPEQTGKDPRTVFPEPTSPRDQASAPNWTAGQEAEERRLVAEFGYGRGTDRTVTELGLSGAHVVFEGGQPHKIRAEV